jgi:hypothetical protein
LSLDGEKVFSPAKSSVAELFLRKKRGKKGTGVCWTSFASERFSIFSDLQISGKAAAAFSSASRATDM